MSDVSKIILPLTLYLIRFCNQAGKAIDILKEMMKNDTKGNINEQVILNMMSFYEVQYPAAVSQ